MKTYDIINSEVAVLRKIVKATKAERGYQLMEVDDFKILEDQGLCESNDAISKNGLVAVRATDEGVQFIHDQDGEVVKETPVLTVATMQYSEKQPTEAVVEISDQCEATIIEAKATPITKTKKPMSNIQILDVTDVPSIARSAKKSKYPFATLSAEAPGNAFFIPATEENPEPWKKMQSSLTNANKMYAVPTGGTRINKKGNEVPETVQERKFIARHVIEPAEGVMVIRVK